jgi:tetratricopeptide (TPR) repeat protein
MTLEERIAFEQKMLRPPSAIRTVWQFLKTEGLIIGLIILWVTMAIISRNPWSRSSLVAYVSAIGYAVFSIGVRVPVRWYGRLLEARLWHRWDDVDRAVARLRRGRTFGGGAIPEWELIFSEARAMAGRGHLAAALEKVRPLEKSGTMAAEIYYSYLGALYEIAGDYKSKVVAIGQAVAANPKSLQTRIDLAFTLGAMLRDWEAAREALSGVNPADLVPMARIYLGFVEGVMALDEGRLPEAEKAIREAREGWRQFEGHQLAKGVGWLMKGFHAIALRRLGKNAEAEAEFAAVKFYLQQTEADFVFSRWEGR